MSSLSQVLGKRVKEWREAGYPAETPLIAELLRFQKDDDGRLRFLRRAQLEAIEVYLYLRVVLGNKHVFELYKEFFGNDLFKALNIPITIEEIANLAINQGRV